MTSTSARTTAPQRACVYLWRANGGWRTRLSAPRKTPVEMQHDSESDARSYCRALASLLGAQVEEGRP